MKTPEEEYQEMIDLSKSIIKEINLPIDITKNTYYLTTYNYQYYAYFLNSDIFKLEDCLVLSQKGRYYIDNYCVNITNNQLINYNIDRMNDIVSYKINYYQKYIDNVNQYIIELIDYLKANNIIGSEPLDKLQNFEDVALYNIDGHKNLGVIKMQNFKTFNFVYVDYLVLKEFHQSQSNQYVFYFNDLFKKSNTLDDLKKLKLFRSCKFVPLKEYIKTCTVEQYNSLNKTSPISISEDPLNLYYFYPLEICKDVELPIKQPHPLPEYLVVRTDNNCIISSVVLLVISSFVCSFGVIIINNFPNNLLICIIGCILIGFPFWCILNLLNNFNKMS